MIVVGIDPGAWSAAAIGLAVMENGRPMVAGRKHWSTPQRSLESAREHGQLARLTFGSPPFDRAVLAWIERPMGQHVREVANLMRTAGSIAAWIPPTCAVEEIAPQDWKRLVGLPGNASKEAVQAWCRGEGFDPASEHEADAYAIARAAWQWSERGGVDGGEP